jgi:hypothetical protein
LPDQVLLLRSSDDVDALRRLVRARAMSMGYDIATLTRLVAAATDIARTAIGYANAAVRVETADRDDDDEEAPLRLSFEGDGIDQCPAIARARRLVTVLVEQSPPRVVLLPER